MAITRRQVVRTLGALAGSTLVAAPAIRAQAQARTLILAHHLNTLHVAHKAAERFAALVAQRTNNELRIEIRPAGQMFNLRTSAEAIRIGTLDLCWTDLATLANWRQHFGFIMLPFLFRDYDHVHKFMFGPVADTLKEEVRSTLNIEILALGGSGFRIFNGKRAIANAADCERLKLRVPDVPISVAMARGLGATPVPIPGPEIYTALQTGVIDAIEVPPDSIVANRWYEVAPHSSRTHHMYTEVSLMASVQVYRSLGPERSRILSAAATEVVRDWMWPENLREQEAAWATVAQRTTAVANPDRASFVAKMQPVVASFVERNGQAAKRYVDAITAL